MSIAPILLPSLPVRILNTDYLCICAYAIRLRDIDSDQIHYTWGRLRASARDSEITGKYSSQLCTVVRVCVYACVCVCVSAFTYLIPTTIFADHLPLLCQVDIQRCQTQGSVAERPEQVDCALFGNSTH
jgi:hypothetical protein